MSDLVMDIGGGFVVDAVEYASRANAILGIRDSGKTFTGTKIAECLLDVGIPFFAFDPIGRWRFLRVPGVDPRVAGGASGFPVVVLGGAAPDLPLDTKKIADVIRAAMKSCVSMVIDLYDVKLSKSEWRQIVRTSIETILYENEAHAGGLRHVFLEEAAEFCPQRVYDGQTYAAVEKLVRMGGNAGVGVTLINQRAEEVNKAVLELCDNLLLHRQRGKNSLTSLRKWLDAGNVKPPKEITDSLADLPTGQCWAWFKDVGRPKLIQVGRKRSFDPNRRAMAAKLTSAIAKPVDVSKFVEQLRAALAGGAKPVPKAKEDPDVKESEAKALREQNARLEAEIEDWRAGRRVRGEDPKRATMVSPPPKPNDWSPEHRGAIALSAPADFDAIYEAVKARAMSDPSILHVLAARPEIEVTVEVRKIQMDGSNYKGRIAKMLAEGFYDGGQTNSQTRSELKRTGKDMDNRSIGRCLDELVSWGFMTRDGPRYLAVKGMKVNVVEA